MNSITFGQVRTVVAALGGVLVTLGVTTAEELALINDTVATVGGALMALVAAGWSAWEKWTVRNAVAQVAAAAVDPTNPVTPTEALTRIVNKL